MDDAGPGLPQLTLLIERAREGDRRALDRVCDLLEPHMRQQTRRQMGLAARRWAESADIVQQVLFEVLGDLDGRDVIGGAEELLKRLCRRTEWRVLDLLRQRSRDAGQSAVEGFSEVHAPPPASSGPVTRDDTRRWLEELIASLPGDYASVVRLCALEGMSYVDAGRALGIGADTVRKRYEKARDALARRVRERRYE